MSALVIDSSAALSWCFKDDAAYLELSIRRGLPLITRDEALIAAAERTGVAIPV